MTIDNRDELLSLLQPLQELHHEIRAAVVEACEASASGDLSAVAHESRSDTIYAIDRVSEQVLVDFAAEHIAPICPIILIAEGLESDLVLPTGTDPESARWRIIVDPIDGTRGLMYQKRSAWILTGVAPNLGPDTCLADIELAVQTEIPLVKQHKSDELWAVRGGGVSARRYDRVAGTHESLGVGPSRADGIEHGFSTVCRFFPGAREELAALDEEIVGAAIGPVRAGRALCFEDQYISSGGQLYELTIGHDRFVADLRPTVEPLLAARGVTLGICSHPYDVCTELIAREAGVVVTDAAGQDLRARLNVVDDVAWVGYANPAIRKQIEPLLQSALRRRQLI